MKDYFWFGQAPGKPLVSIEDFAAPLRATRNKEAIRPPRLNHRLVPKALFEPVPTMDGILERLFNGLPRRLG